MGIPGATNPLLLASQGGYQISRSLRFNSSDSAFCSRTPTSAGNRRIFTFAAWIKRSTLSAAGYKHIFSTGTVLSEAGYFGVSFWEDKLDITTGAADLRKTTAVYRDTSAWYHIVIAVDTTQATAANRVKVYVNGDEVTTFQVNVNPTQNADLAVNNTGAHNIGRNTYNSSDYFDGYLAECYLIDGQQLTPSSFTEVSATTGQLIPKAYTGTYGSNGFKLTFSDNSNITATTLGKDSSPNGNNWTPNNFSVTAGAGNDSLVDTPSSTGTDTGAGGEVRGNYATWNPTLHSLNGNKPNLSNGNLDQSGNISNIGSFGLSTILPGSGKWYMEVTMANANFGPGIWKTPLSPSSYAYQQTNFRYFGDGNVYNQAGTVVASYSTFTTGDVIAVALDLDNGKVFFSKNGTWQGSSNPVTGANPAGSTGIDATWTFGLQSTDTATGTCNANFGQRPFAYTAPSGFKALVDTNLPTPVVAKPSTVFDTKLYTGNGSTQTVSGLGFSPDLVWIKNRSNGEIYHNLFDTVRGSARRLSSNVTDSELLNSPFGYLSDFTGDGFSIQAGSSGISNVGTNNEAYVAWAWDAGSSTVTNTQGSITSSVRANASAGFSVVTMTTAGTGTYTWGHGLGVVPAMVIVKDRDNAGTSWFVYHSAVVTNTSQYLNLNTTGALATAAGIWGSALPTSTVVSMTANTGVFANAKAVAYCFAPVAGYSSGFSYTGNGSTDGSFVYLGFRPRLILLKCSSTTGNWTLLDTAREGYNVDNDPLYPNLSDAEGTTDLLDITSNGFKLRTTDASVNSSGATYVGYAWAEAPFAYSRAR